VLTGESGPHTLTPCLARGPGEPPDDQARPVNRRPFVPDALTGILVPFQGVSRLLR
jgi:hypothetical protein